MINIAGNWNMIRRDNHEDYVFSLLGHRIKKKKVKKGKYRLIIEQEVDKIKRLEETKIIGGSIVEVRNEYIPDGITPTQEKLFQFKTTETITSFKDDKLIMESTWPKGNLRTEYYFEDDVLVQVNTNVSENVIAKYYYEQL